MQVRKVEQVAAQSNLSSEKTGWIVILITLTEDICQVTRH